MQYLLIKLLLLFNAVISSSGQIRRDHRKNNLINRNIIKYNYGNDEKLDDAFSKCKRTSADGLSQRNTSPSIPFYALQSELIDYTSEITNSVQNETNNDEFKIRKPFIAASDLKSQPLIVEISNPANAPRKTDRKFTSNYPNNKNKSVDNVHSNDELSDDIDAIDEQNTDGIKTEASKKMINRLFSDNSEECIDVNVNELDYSIPNKSDRHPDVNTFVKIGSLKKSHNKIYKDVNMSLKPKLYEYTDNPVPLKAQSEKVFTAHNCRNDALHDIALHQLHNIKLVHSYHPQIDDIGGSNETTTHEDGDVTTSGNQDRASNTIFMSDLEYNDIPPVISNKFKKKKNFVHKDLNCVLKTNLDTHEAVLYCYKKRPVEDRMLSPRVMIGVPINFGVPIPEFPPINPQVNRISPQLGRFSQFKPLVFLNAPLQPNPPNIVLEPPPTNAIKFSDMGFIMM